jgi:hypothetical protein
MRPEIIQTMVEGRTYVITLNKKLLFISGGHQYFYTGKLRDFILSKDGTVVGIHIGKIILSTDSIDYIMEWSL